MYKPGETIKLPTLANTLRRMVEAERKAKEKGRAAGIVAARDRFYKGDIAGRWWRSCKAHDAPFELSDFSEFFASVEEPTSTTYEGYTVYKQGFGSQGPSLLQTLNILENFDLRAMGHDSADYIHTVIEAMKLSYADRDTLLRAIRRSCKRRPKGCCRRRTRRSARAMIDPKHASKAFIAGDPMPFDSKVKEWPYWKANAVGRRDAPRRTPMPTLLASAGIRRTRRTCRSSTRTATCSTRTSSGGWISGASSSATRASA